jgi:hypothetical protein
VEYQKEFSNSIILLQIPCYLLPVTGGNEKNPFSGNLHLGEGLLIYPGFCVKKFPALLPCDGW